MNTEFSVHFSPQKESSHPPILFLAGLWSTKETWVKWQNLTAHAGFESWAMTLGPKKAKNGLLDYLNSALDIINHLQQRPVIIGHSMAGLVTQMIAEHYQLPGVILLNSAAPSGISNYSLAMTLRLPQYLSALLSGDLFRPSRRTARAILFNNLHLSTTAFEDYYQELVPDSGLAAREIILGTHRVKDTFCPTLVIGGKKDKILPLRIQRALCQKYQYAELLEIDFGHMTMLESNSNIVLFKILDWITKLPPH